MTPSTFTRLWKVGKPFWTSERRWTALAYLIAVLVLLTANAGVSVYVNMTAGRFMTAIEQRSVSDFYYYLALYAGALVVATPIQVFYGYLRTRLALVWRTWLATSLFSGYFSNLVYFKLLGNKDIDNPDQRMTQDVDSFCNSSVGLFISILDAVVNVVTFIGVLWAISPTLTYTVIGYSFVGSLIVVLIGRALIGLNFMQMKTEADLRFGLAETRREAESIAFTRGEAIARKQAESRLKRVIDTLWSMAGVNRNIQFFTNGYNMMAPLIPAAIIAPLYFAGNVPFGHITQATMAFTIVFNGCTFMIAQFGGISSYAATINRLGGFMEMLEKIGVEKLPEGKSVEVVEADSIVFDHVTVSTPDHARDLVVDLSIDVPRGGLLVTGPDGSGKSALLRVISGIWTAGRGRLMRPDFKRVMFLSQSPYLPSVTLREALSYPCIDNCADDTRLAQVLEIVGLGQLIERAGGLDVVQSWRDFLSAGEQQRLSMCRVILAQPEFVVLDEATNALEGENEKLLYGLLAGMGATVVSAGNGPNLARYHHKVVELAGDGSWKVLPAKTYKPTFSFVKEDRIRLFAERETENKSTENNEGSHER